MANPLISVIIPTYNSEKYISETLDSVFSQGFRKFEVIVIDDGSIDETVDIVRKYYECLPAGSPQLILITQFNAGPSCARNVGIKQAKGEFVAFIDSDDLWLPDTLANMITAMNKHSECGLVFGDASSFDNTGMLIRSVFEKYGRPSLSANGCVEKPFSALLEGNFILTGAVLMRKACLLETGCFDESLRYGEDAGVWLRAALLAPIALIPEVLLCRRIHEGNASNVAINKKDKFDYFAIKLYLLRQLISDYSCRFKWLDDTIKKDILKTKKKRAYWSYLNKKHLKAIFLYLNYFFSSIKSSFVTFYKNIS